MKLDHPAKRIMFIVFILSSTSLTLTSFIPLYDYKKTSAWEDTPKNYNKTTDVTRVNFKCAGRIIGDVQAYLKYETVFMSIKNEYWRIAEELYPTTTIPLTRNYFPEDLKTIRNHYRNNKPICINKKCSSSIKLSKLENIFQQCGKPITLYNNVSGNFDWLIDKNIKNREYIWALSLSIAIISLLSSIFYNYTLGPIFKSTARLFKWVQFGSEGRVHSLANKDVTINNYTHHEETTDIIKEPEECFDICVTISNELHNWLKNKLSSINLNVNEILPAQEIMEQHWLQPCTTYCYGLVVACAYKKNKEFLGSSSHNSFTEKTVNLIVTQGNETTKLLGGTINESEANKFASKEISRINHALESFIKSVKSNSKYPMEEFHAYLAKSIGITIPEKNKMSSEEYFENYFGDITKKLLQYTCDKLS